MTTPHPSYPAPAQARVRAPVWEYVLFVGVVAGAALYAIACAVELFAVNSIRSIAVAIVRGEHVDAATLHSRLALATHGLTAVSVTFWAMYVLFIAWLIVIGKRFTAAGNRAGMRRLPAYIAWRAGVIVSFFLVILGNTAFGSVAVGDVESVARREMAYLFLRLIVGCLYIWCAWGMWAARQSLQPAPPAASPMPYAGHVTQRAAAVPLPYAEYVAQRAAASSPAEPASSSVVPAAPTPTPEPVAATPTPEPVAATPTPEQAAATPTNQPAQPVDADTSPWQPEHRSTI